MKPITKQEIEQELMLIGWWNQLPNIVHLEIEQTMKRLEIDDSLFKLCFMTEINKSAKEDFQKIIDDHKVNYETNKAVTLIHNYNKTREYKYYDGKIIFEYIIKQYNKRANMSILTLVCVFGYSIGNVFLPAAIRAYFGQSSFGNSAFEYITYTGNGLFIFFLVFTTLLFFMAGIRDMKRRAYILNQLGQYLSPKKLQVYKDEKLLPSVNILDQTTLHSWIDLRKLAIDYGKKYFFRHEIFMPVAFYTAAACLLLIFFILINFLTFGTTENDIIEKNKMIVVLGVTALYFLVLFFWMLYSSAHVNEQFDLHKKILKVNKDLIQDIEIFRDFYFKEYLGAKTDPDANIPQENLQENGHIQVFSGSKAVFEELQGKKDISPKIINVKKFQNEADAKEDDKNKESSIEIIPLKRS